MPRGEKYQDYLHMNNVMKNTVVPRLRFPEFIESEEWVEDTLANLASFRRGSFPQPYGLPKWYDEINGMPFIQVYDVGDDFRLKPKTKSKISKLGAELSVFIPKGTVIITIQGSIGRVAITQYDAYIDRTLLLFEIFFNPINKIFFAYVLFLLFEIEKLKAPGGIIKTITKEVLSDFKIGIPTIKEQQKIADCLSSLDDLITLESQKLEALKVHKKGLMQQLFPAEGETVPKLRFEEFKESGEWEEKSIQRLIDDNVIISHLDGNHGELYPRAEEFSQEGIPYISANDFISGFVNFKKCKYLPEKRAKQFKKGVAKDGDILFAHNATVGPVAKLKTDYPFVVLSTTATYFRCDNTRLSNDFLKFAFTSSEFVHQYSRVMSQSTRNQVPITTQRKFNLRLPKIVEQKKIADSLSSLDELITALAEKIEGLKMHKKGLMQGLFPNTN